MVRTDLPSLRAKRSNPSRSGARSWIASSLTLPRNDGESACYARLRDARRCRAPQHEEPLIPSATASPLSLEVRQVNPTGKILPFAVGQITYDSAHPVPHEGRITIVADVGCGMRWTRQCRGRTTLKRTASHVVLTPRRRRQVSGSNSADDGDKKARSPGREHEAARLKPARAGMPGYPGATVVTNSCAFHILHARLRVHWAPGIPHALCYRGRKVRTQLRAHRAAGMRRCVLASMTALRLAV